MVIVERSHYPVGCVTVKTVGCVVDDGVEYHYHKAGNVTPYETVDVFRIFEQQGAQEISRHYEPQARNEEFQ